MNELPELEPRPRLVDHGATATTAPADYEQKGAVRICAGRRCRFCLGSNLLLAFNQEIERLSDPDLLDKLREPFLR